MTSFPGVVQRSHPADRSPRTATTAPAASSHRTPRPPLWLSAIIFTVAGPTYCHIPLTANWCSATWSSITTARCRVSRGHCGRGRCGWFGAGEIGPVRTQYQLGSFASVRSGSAQLCHTNIADEANCRYTPQKGLCAISAGGGEIGRYSGVSGPTEADGRFLSIHF